MQQRRMTGKQVSKATQSVKNKRANINAQTTKPSKISIPKTFNPDGVNKTFETTSTLSNL